MRTVFQPARVFVAIAAIAAMLMLLAPLDSNTAVAQEDSEPRTRIDLAVELIGDRTTRPYRLDVRNNSDVRVNNVKVRIETGNNQLVKASTGDSGSFAEGVLTIPTIAAGQVVDALLGKHPSTSVSGFFPIRAEIISSSPRETPGLEYNNRAEVWAYVFAGQTGLIHTTGTSVGMTVSVDDLRPALDGQAVFEIQMKNLSIHGGTSTGNTNKVGVQVKITLTPGLSFALSSMTDTTISGNTATWRVGDFPSASDATRTKALSVPVRLSGSAPLEKRCLTAEVTQVTPPDPEHERFDDAATVCLGDGPRELLGAWAIAPDLQRHRIDLFSSFPCIGVTTYPCDTDDTLELVTEVPLDYPHTGSLKQRRDDERVPPESDDAGVMYLQPESVLVHVDDPVGRTEKDGSAIWSTGRLMYVTTSQTRLTSSWQIGEAVTVTAPGGGDAPGRWLFTNLDDSEHGNFDVLDAPDSTRVFYDPFDLSDIGSDPEEYDLVGKIDFWALGTYKALYEITGVLSGTTYTDSGTYTFHVGPVAELEVRDAGANPQVAGNRGAYTIEAVNNGPSDAGRVRVTLTGVPEGAVAEASRGDYAQGSCDQDGLCEAFWTIDRLERPESRPRIGRPETETLTLIADGEPITANIESIEDYTVCVDSDAGDVDASDRSACESGGNSWHTAEYYDHVTDNNTAQIASRTGTGRGHPEAPTLLRARKFATAVLLDWQPVEMLNGHPVTHYEVMRQRGALWEPLSSSVDGTLYAYVNPGQQLRAYRVRAVNRFGVPGPWSWPSDHGQPQFYSGDDARTEPRDFTATVSLDGKWVDLAWLPAATEGATVDRYQLESRQRTSDDWDCLREYPAGPCPPALGGDATSAVHAPSPSSGEEANLVGRHYRIRAVFDDEIEGPWATTRAVDKVPGIPGNFEAVLSDSGNAAVLTWTAPASRPAITGYVIDISESADGDSRTNDRTVGGGVTTWTHTGLGAGDVKYYRVRARSSAGEGGWTHWQDVGTGAGAPGSLRAQANGPNEIVLTWSKPSSRDVEVSHYDLEYSDFSATEGYEWRPLVTVFPEDGLRYVDVGMGPASTRHYRVRAWTVDPDLPAGAWSGVASATTTEAGPDAPLYLVAEADGENRIRLTWEAPASGNAARYNIEHSTDSDVWESERSGHTGTCTIDGQTLFCYTDSGLHSGTEHWYRVAGVTRSGVAGEWSAPVWATTAGDPTEAPYEPENLRITGVSGRQVSLAWDPPLDDGGSRVTGYEYRAHGPCAHDRNETCEVIKTTRTGGTSVTVTVPNVKGHYGFEVRALNVAGGGWWTAPVGAFVDPQRTWRVTLTPSSLAVDEGGEATYRVKLTSDPGRPVMVALWWDGDPDLGNTLAGQQFKWLLPSNWQDPDGYVDPQWSYAWNVGVPITVTADEDADSDNGTLEITNTIYYVLCADLGNPDGCVDDPEDGGADAFITVTERDND